MFEDPWRQVGLSVDWNLTYTTIGPKAQRASQRAFLRNLARGEAYAAEAPTLWDVTDPTAVAQADLNDFVACYQSGDRTKRVESERFKRFTYDEITARDKANLDITLNRPGSDGGSGYWFPTPAGSACGAA